MPKRGFVTPSGIARMMTAGRGKKEWGKVAYEYAKELALQRIGIDVPEYAYGNAIDWGNEHEPEALAVYEFKNVVQIHGSQEFIEHPELEWVGGTPDGLIGKQGGVDVKCPYKVTNHLNNILYGAQLDDYKWQLQGYMWITGRQWWDLASYDPRFTPDLQLWVIRQERDQELIDQIESRYQEFEEIIKQYAKQLQQVAVHKH